MEVVVNLEIRAVENSSSYDSFASVFDYLTKTPIIIFEEQFDTFGVELDQNKRTAIKAFTQKHSEFQSVVEDYEKDNNHLSVQFIGGYDTPSAVLGLKKLLEAFDVERYTLTQIDD